MTSRIKRVLGRHQLLLVAVALILLSVIALQAIHSSNSSTVNPESQMIGVVLSPDALGQPVNLAEAQRQAIFSFKVPQDLPAQTTLERATISQDNRIVRLFYNNPTLPDAQAFGGSLPFPAQMVIYMQVSESNPVSKVVGGQVQPIVVEVQDENGKKVAQIIPQQPVGEIVKVCSVDGFGRDPKDSESGILIFWKDDVEYTIVAKLPLTKLVKIASSMC